MQQREERLFNDPKFVTLVVRHVSNGGYLKDLADTLDINFSAIHAFMNQNPMRAKQLADAIRIREALTEEEILQGLRAVYSADIRQLFDAQGNLLAPDQWPADAAKAVASVEKGEKGDKIKLYDKLKAKELAGKPLKLFTDRVEHTGKITLEDLVAGSMKDANSR